MKPAGSPRHRSRVFACVALAAALCCGAVAADSATLDAAVQKYYAGLPGEAIAMIEPLAAAGDAQAQYLLGNLLYTLAQTGQPMGDPLPWYRRAAAQDSGPANHALGTLLQNRWLQSRRDDDAEQARQYFARAAELGEAGAPAALDRLAAHRRSLAGNRSLTYTNESFSSKRVVADEQPVEKAPPPVAARPAARVTTLEQLLARFESSGDPLEDAQRLKELLGQADAKALAATGSGGGSIGGLLGGFDSYEDLLGKLIELYGHIETATELSTAPGAN